MIKKIKEVLFMKKCNMCGSDLLDSYNACPNCGNTNLTVMPAAPQVPGQNSNMNMGQGAVMPNQPVQQPVQQPMYGQPGPGVPGQPMYGQPGPVVGPQVQEKGNFGWGVLGFLIPIVGWILYFVWKNTRPGDAKMAGIGGLIGFAVNMIIQFI
jgi:hypothetical protein